MASEHETTSPVRAPDPRWARAVHTAAVVSLLLAVGPILVLMIVPSAMGEVFAAVLTCPLGLVYLGILWSLRVQKHGRALAGALSVSLPAIIIAWTAVLFISLGGGARWLLVSFQLLALTQLALLVSGIGARYTIRPEPPHGRRPLRGLGYGLFFAFFLYAFLFGIVYGGLRGNWPAANQASAVGTLGSIHKAATTYEETYANGYPLDRWVLVPPPVGTTPGCNAAGLLDATRASRQRYGYVFEYWPGPRVETPPFGCLAGVQSYTISARPLLYGKTGTTSFFADETGIIRQTSKDRRATADDPPIPH